MKTLKVLLMAFAGVAIGLIALFVFERGVEKQEKSECFKWQKEALTFPDYYLTGWQSAQCKNYGIEINATVQKLPRM